MTEPTNPTLPLALGPVPRPVIQRIVQHLAHGHLHRALGRFFFMRRAYSAFQRVRQSQSPAYFRARLPATAVSVLAPVDGAASVRRLSRDGVAFGLELPAPLVNALGAFARQSQCIPFGTQERVWPQAVVDGRLPDGRIVTRASVADLGRCPEVDQIARDPRLLQIAAGYLRYWPNTCRPQLTWSFRNQLSPEEYRAHCPVADYHYDLSGYNFVQVFFYLTDVDISSGAHVMIMGSHRDKSLPLLLAIGPRPDAVIHAHYGRVREIVIEGRRGFGFIQDSSCFHKVLSPATRTRLILQIRYL